MKRLECCLVGGGGRLTPSCKLIFVGRVIEPQTLNDAALLSGCIGVQHGPARRMRSHSSQAMRSCVFPTYCSAASHSKRIFDLFVCCELGKLWQIRSIYFFPPFEKKCKYQGELSLVGALPFSRCSDSYRMRQGARQRKPVLHK